MLSLVHWLRVYQRRRASGEGWVCFLCVCQEHDGPDGLALGYYGCRDAIGATP